MSRRHKAPPPQPGTVDVPTVAIICSDAGQHPAARLYDLLDGRDIGRGETVLWVGESPERSFAGDVPVYAFRCRRCGKDVPLRLPTLLAEIDAARVARPGRARPVVDISRLRTVLA